MIQIREDIISTKKREHYSQTLLFFESNNKKSVIEFFNSKISMFVHLLMGHMIAFLGQRSS